MYRLEHPHSPVLVTPVIEVLLYIHIGPVSKQRRASDKEKSLSNELRPDDLSSYQDTPHGDRSGPNKSLLTSCPQSPSVFENTPYKKLLLQQWGKEIRVMEGQKKREVLLADLAPDDNYSLTFPPHPFSEEGEYNFSRWGYTLSSDSSLYTFRGAPKRHALSTDTEREEIGSLPDCVEPVSPEREEDSDSEWVKKLPIKKQLVYLFNKKEREKQALLLEAEKKRSAHSQATATESHVDVTSDISQDSEDTKLDISDGEQDDSTPVESPRVHSTTSDQLLPTTETGYMSPLPVQYSPSPQSSPNPVSPLSMASSSQDSATSAPTSPKIPHTPSPDPPPQEEGDTTSDQISESLHPPTQLSRADSCVSQVSSTLNSPQYLPVLKPLVSDYVSPASSPAVIHTDERKVSSNKESQYSHHPIVTQDISPAEETPRGNLIHSSVPQENQYGSHKVGLGQTKASSLDSAISSDYRLSKTRLTPDPPHRRSLTSHHSPRLIDSKQLYQYTPLSEKRRHRDMIELAPSRMDLSVQFGSPSMDTDLPITPVESVTPLSDVGSNLSASGKKVVSMKEYFKRKEQSRASSSSSQTHLHISPGHTPPPPRRERSHSNSSVNISEPSFWTECRRKEKRPDWDRDRDRYHHTWDSSKSHSRHHNKESAYRSKERSRDKHKSKYRERYRDRYEDSSGHYTSRDHRRRASSGVFDETRSRHNTFKNTEPSRPPCPSLVEIEPVSPENSGGEDNVISPTAYTSDRRFSTSTSLPFPHETIPPDDSRILTLKVLLRQTTEQGNNI